MKKTSGNNVTPLRYESYLAVIKNSVETKMFRNFYAKVNGKKRDIVREGELSCALFVSSLLTMFGLIQRIHGTVDGTVFDLEKSGWKKVPSPKPGDVLVWEARLQGKEIHKHIGFSIGRDQAVSNSSKKGVPVQHHWLFGRIHRKVIAIYRKIAI